MFALVGFLNTRDTAVIDCDQICEPNDRQRGAVTEVLLDDEKKMAKVIDISGKNRAITFQPFEKCIIKPI